MILASDSEQPRIHNKGQYLLVDSLFTFYLGIQGEGPLYRTTGLHTVLMTHR